MRIRHHGPVRWISAYRGHVLVHELDNFNLPIVRTSYLRRFENGCSILFIIRLPRNPVLLSWTGLPILRETAASSKQRPRIMEYILSGPLCSIPRSTLFFRRTDPRLFQLNTGLMCDVQTPTAESYLCVVNAFGQRRGVF